MAGDSTVVAVDVGGTSLKAARYDGRGTCEERALIATPDRPTDIVDAIGALAASLVAPDTRSVGVVVPGVVDPVSGVVEYATNLGWRDIALRSLLSDRLMLPVAIDHDVAAATMSEVATATMSEFPTGSISGDDAAASTGSLLFLALGTGVSAGWAVDGQVWRGASGRAGELGHASVVPDGEPCDCGQHGCLEVYASGAGIARRYAAAGGEPGADASSISARLAHDPVAARVWADAVAALATALTTVVLLLDPSVIVLGGGVSCSGPVLFDPLRSALARRLAWRTPPDIRPARWGADAGLRGAASVAWRGAPAEPVGVPA